MNEIPEVRGICHEPRHCGEYRLMNQRTSRLRPTSIIGPPMMFPSRGSVARFVVCRSEFPRPSARDRSGIVQSDGGVAIVDPGPTTCLSTLELGLQQHGVRWNDVRHILLTHIHLDHAGATGTIVRAHPHISVFVHERGAPHMVDPEADRQRDAPVRRRHEPAVGRDRAGAAGTW